MKAVSFILALGLVAGCESAPSGGSDSSSLNHTVTANASSAPAPTLVAENVQTALPPAQPPVSDAEAASSAAICFGWEPKIRKRMRELITQDLDLAKELDEPEEAVPAVVQSLTPMEIRVAAGGNCVGTPLPPWHRISRTIPHVAVIRTERKKGGKVAHVNLLFLVDRSGDGTRNFVSLSGDVELSLERDSAHVT